MHMYRTEHVNIWPMQMKSINLQTHVQVIGREKMALFNGPKLDTINNPYKPKHFELPKQEFGKTNVVS